jgi:hypothetical protein
MHARVLRDAEFVTGAVDTGYLGRLLEPADTMTGRDPVRG